MAIALGDAAAGLAHLAAAEGIIALAAARFPDRPDFARDLAGIRASLDSLRSRSAT